MTKTMNNIELLDKQVRSLPSMQDEALKEIIKGLYQGKPLLDGATLICNTI